MSIEEDCKTMCNALQRIESGDPEPRMIARRALETESARLSRFISDISLIECARVRGQPGTPLDHVMAAFDIVTQEVLPTAWMRGVTSYTGANEPPDHDAEFSYGDDKPNGDGWVPLYRLRKLEARQASDAGESK